MGQIRLLVIAAFVAGVSAGLCLSASIPFGIVALISGLGILLGGMMLAQNRRRGVAALVLPSGGAPPHDRLFRGVLVWFPRGGEWVLGIVEGPVDPERTRYRVREGQSLVFKRPVREVEHGDLRSFDKVLTDPAPVMTVPEMEEQLAAERAARPVEGPPREGIWREG